MLSTALPPSLLEREACLLMLLHRYLPSSGPLGVQRSALPASPRSILLTHLESTLARWLVSVHSKGLMESLSYLESTLTQKLGGRFPYPETSSFLFPCCSASSFPQAC